MLLQKRKNVFKILVVGDYGVGKTSLLKRHVEDKFDTSIAHSISDNYFKTQIDFDSRISAHLQLWDFGGQAKHRHLLNNFVSGARGALILIDMTKPLKIKNILEWINMVRQAEISLPIVLVGTKCDLISENVIKEKEIEHVMRIFNISNYIESSAKNNVNIFKVLYTITKKLMEH